MRYIVVFSYILLIFLGSCNSDVKIVKTGLEDMVNALPKNINLDSLRLKGEVVSNYQVKYLLTNQDQSVDLIVTLFDEHLDERLKEYRKKLPAIAAKNGIPVSELNYGIRYKTTNFCNTVRTVLKSCEAKEEHTSFYKTDNYIAGFTQNRADVLIFNRYCLSIYMHSAKKLSHKEFQPFIFSYLNSFNFNELQQ